MCGDNNMIYHINDYHYDQRWIFYDKKLVSSDLINSVTNYVLDNKNKLDDALIGVGSKYDSNVRRTKIMWLESENGGIPSEVISVYDEILKGVRMVNADMWNYDIFGLDTLQYSLYEEGERGHYDWHIDCPAKCSLGSFLRKLTIVIGLSDDEDYVGGDLKVKMGYDENQDCYKLGMGDVCIFPSFLLHKVEPVESGLRKTLVGWATGSSFK